jgi:predicted lipoprotein with Yx(FWY)xxD motif
MANRRSQLEIGPGEVLRRLTPEETEQLYGQWELAYPADRDGIHIEQFMWHVFSFGRYPSVSQAAALAEYEKQEAPKYMVLADDKTEGLITDLRPATASIADYLVCPLNWAWKMAFTHEDEDLGPYFAVHRDYGRLQAANVKGMRKLREAAIAKQQGWAKGDRSS